MAPDTNAEDAYMISDEATNMATTKKAKTRSKPSKARAKKRADVAQSEAIIGRPTKYSGGKKAAVYLLMTTDGRDKLRRQADVQQTSMADYVEGLVNGDFTVAKKRHTLTASK